MDTDREGRTDLHYAANERKIVEVRRLIKAGYDVNLQDKMGWAPLHFAAQASCVETARILIEAGAHIDPTDAYGNTPLWRAVFSSRGKADLIGLLREKGADPCKKNNHEVSPLILAQTMSNDVKQYFSDLPESS